MLELILGSKVKIKILRRFTETPRRELTLEELSSTTKLSHGSIFPAVKRLVEGRILTARKVGRSVLYALNTSNPFVKETLKLFSLETNAYTDLAKRFVKRFNPRKFKGIKKVILFGSVARNTSKLGSDIDLLFILTKSNKHIENGVQAVTQDFLRKNDVIISPLFMTEKEFSSNIDFVIRVKIEGVILYERRNKR